MRNAEDGFAGAPEGEDEYIEAGFGGGVEH
jgi:hypothetical protein